VPKFSAASESKLVGVHPDLQRVMRRAILETPVDFRITEGLRTLARQKQLVAAGASQTMRSRHLTGHAVDVVALVGGKVRWDWPLYARIAAAVKAAAIAENVPIVWGGDWKSLRDGPHFELDRRTYP
jgi:peptidoglycan L-alanyl-D-glutamate endopeptidase CwlK